MADGAGYPLQRLRQAVRDAILRQVPDARTAGVLAALVVGDQAAIEREDWGREYRSTDDPAFLALNVLSLSLVFGHPIVTLVGGGAVLAICVRYRRKLISVALHLHNDANARRFTTNLLLAFLPAAVAGVLAGHGRAE